MMKLTHFFLIVMLILVPSIVLGHGLVTTQHQISGQFLVEFEYNTIGNIAAGDLTTFDVYLLDSDQNPVDFDGAYIKLAQASGAPALVGNMQEDPVIRGSARLSGILKDPGEYTSEVHFNRDGQNIAQANFKFTVDPSVGSPQTNNQRTTNTKSLWVYSLAAGIVGLILGLIIKRKRT